MTRQALAVAVIATAVVAVRPGAQSSPQTPAFRTAVEAVQLDVRVVDGDGRFVRDLKPEDFHVLEDGREQKVSTFQLIDLPPMSSAAIELAGTRIEPDVVSNLDPADGHLYVIVMDDRAIKFGEDDQAYRFRSITFRELAREFIEHHVGDADRTAIMSTSGRTDFSVDFTSNRQVLLDAAARFEAGFGAEPVRGRISQNPLLLAYRSLRELSNWLSHIPGRRKTIVLISENMGVMDDTMTLDALGNTMVEGSDFRDMIDAANRANVSIYILDPVGMPGAPYSGIKPIHVGDGADLNLDRRMQLQMMAEATGGFALTGSNEFIPAMHRIVEETSSYYLLGYAPTNTKRDGKFRSLKVTVMRPGLKVQTRLGYVAAKATPATSIKTQGLPPAVAQMIQSPLPVSGLAMRIAAMARRGKGSTAVVTMIVEATGRDLQFSERNGERTGGMSFVTTAADQNAHVRGSERTNLLLRLSPGQHAAVERDGVRFLTEMQLKPGRYQVKVAGQETLGPRHGVVLYDLTVPDFGRGAFSMTSLAIGSTATARIATAPDNARTSTTPDKTWDSLLGMLPTTKREFDAGDEMHVYAEVYDNNQKAPSVLEAATTVQRESGEVVFGNPARWTVLESDGSTVRRIAGTIPLKTLGAGRYVLTVKTRSNVEPATVMMRQLPFEVRSEQ
jgi:VWFA-related protein